MTTFTVLDAAEAALAGTVACTGCGRPIYWVTTARGKRMPMDDIRVVGFAGGQQIDGSLNHWGTCPERARFDRRGERR